MINFYYYSDNYNWRYEELTSIIDQLQDLGALFGDFLLYCWFYLIYCYNQLGSNQSFFAICSEISHSHGYWGFKI